MLPVNSLRWLLCALSWCPTAFASQPSTSESGHQSADETVEEELKAHSKASEQGDEHGEPGEAQEDTEHAVEHEAAHHGNILGVRGMYVRIPGDGKGAGNLWGGGLLYERVLIHNRLALEISTAYFASKVEQSVPVDLLIKVPYEFNSLIEGYIGAGPAIAWVRIEAEDTSSDITPEPHPPHIETGVYPGGIFTAGIYWWTAERIGILTEFDYALVFEEELTQEYEGTLGLVFRL
jgi:hypothetical protein